MIKINDFAKKTGFSIRMLRYLEEMGLLIPKRDENNYRVYTEEQTYNAKWIKKLQNIGLQLKEISHLNTCQWQDQLNIFEMALKREQEIAEIKSDTIPTLKNIVDFIKNEKVPIHDFFKLRQNKNRKIKTLGGEDKFKRSVYNIPMLKIIYENHLTLDTNIKLIATDAMKFNFWNENRKYKIDIFSAFNESTYILGKNINPIFVKGFEMSWRKFLPPINLCKINDIKDEEISQLMGPHDIVIRTEFQYIDSKIDGEIVIPYTPIYTMVELSNKN